MSLDRSAPAVRVGVLGPLALHVDGEPVEVPGLQRRALLAVLALAEGRVLPVGRIIDALWSEELPENASTPCWRPGWTPGTGLDPGPGPAGGAGQQPLC
jgi:hypothetical protein